MADEEKTEETAPAEGGKKFPIIIIVVLILVGLVLAGGISYFVTTQFMSAGNQAAVENRNHDPGVFVKLGDAKEGIIVNVGGIKSSRFLKVGITVELNPENEHNVLKASWYLLLKPRLWIPHCRFFVLLRLRSWMLLVRTI